MPRTVVILAAVLFSLPVFAQAPAAVTNDPVPDAEHPAAMTAFQLPSHGAMLNALIYEAAGVGPHGTVVLLHGFPGNEIPEHVAERVYAHTTTRKRERY